ncbi:hypothetical protein [Paracoccus benzoatiresistens]|uniref:SpoVT-AbrB domain-containing protein n=1 Tax=Paracoccus benzoatiresistens TaxID=2997341 RepID=A0ABT4J8P4_9RHOB|nr:hypothetical protein [Paracoccus sp. EF6]MCZ0963501.1 hypothetical protein [Paracoccus sp. EF6]
MNGTVDSEAKKRWEAILRSVFRRASYDEAFRSMCLTSPGEMLKKFYGVELDSDSIRFAETDEHGALKLPPLAKIRLEEGDLKIVSDGDEMRLARYENWGSESISDLYRQARYENWGSE